MNIWFKFKQVNYILLDIFYFKYKFLVLEKNMITLVLNLNLELIG